MEASRPPLEGFYRILQRSGLLPILYPVLFVGISIFCAANITTRTQLAAAGACLTALLILRFFNKNENIRILFLVIAMFLSVDYFYWRTFSTLTYYGPISFLCAIVLYLAELYGFIVYLLSMFVNADPLDRKPVPLPDDPEKIPTVDIMIPTYNEDRSILEVTLLSALQVEYPKDKLTVYLLDDGGTDQRCNDRDPDKAMKARRRRAELQELCRVYGATYLTREQNVHAKAGNINSGLLHSSGELIAILDADHAPTHDFLANTVGWFVRDPKMFLVQTPHFFTNPDPIEKNLQTFQTMPSENEMFYKVIQRGLDFWNSAFFCGSAALLRRKYLTEVGGVVGETITEDAETALTLHSRGYNSAYIGKPMIAGLSPETLGGFIGQRVRWAQGMVQIFLLKNPLLIPGLTLPQRLCYFSSCFFWFFAFARIVFTLAPTAFLLFGLKIYDANFVDFAAFALPHLIAVFIVSDFLFGRVRWSFVSELYELIQSVYTFPAILKVFLNPRAPQFNVTAKGETLDRDFISPLAKPFYFLLLLNLIGLTFGTYKLIFSPADQFPTSITMVWAGFNVFILLSCLGALLERRQRRVHARMPSEFEAKLVYDKRALPVQVLDMSIGGLAVAMDRVYESELRQGKAAQVEVKLPSMPTPVMFHAVLRNSRTEGDKLVVGIQFEHESLEEMRHKVALVNGSSQRWIDFQTNRERQIGVFRSFIFLFGCGIRYSLEHFGFWILGLIGRGEGSRSKNAPRTA